MKSETVQEHTDGNPPALTIRIREACRITGIGRSKIYELIATGDIDAIKVGRITLISVESLKTFLASCRRRF